MTKSNSSGGSGGFGMLPVSSMFSSSKVFWQCVILQYPWMIGTIHLEDRGSYRREQFTIDSLWDANGPLRLTLHAFSNKHVSSTMRGWKPPPPPPERKTDTRCSWRVIYHVHKGSQTAQGYFSKLTSKILQPFFRHWFSTTPLNRELWELSFELSHP